jgi:AraC family transcriptional regulator
MANRLDGPGALDYRGLEQFGLVGSIEGMSFCVSGDQPYALDLDTDRDVICLLLGAIHSTSCFEDDREAEFTFFGESSAFHPRQGHIRVKATEVKRGFVAFAYSDDFQQAADHGDGAVRRLGHSRSNVQTDRIKHLARYARSRLSGGRGLDPLEMQCLGSLVYLETTRRLSEGQPAAPLNLTNRDFDRIVEFILQELENPISCPQLAAVVNQPLRVVFDGMKSRTGMTPYRFVIEKRVERAQHLLRNSELPIAEVAFACGFSSQQHLTTTLTRLTGLTPMKLRQHG